MDKQDYLLLIEDNVAVQNNNKKILERRGYCTRQAMTLRDARGVIAQQRPRAIILDLMLPDGSGLNFLRELRETSDIPILLLTALGTREHILAGLKAGGDDYLPKPYDLEIFLVRVEALLRRASRLPETVTKGALTLKPSSMAAYLNGEDLVLSQKEFALLMFLVQNENRIMSQECIYENIWGTPMAGNGNAIKVTLSKLRKKISGSDYTIATEYGDGYRFEKA